MTRFVGNLGGLCFSMLLVGACGSATNNEERDADIDDADSPHYECLPACPEGYECTALRRCEELPIRECVECETQQSGDCHGCQYEIRCLGDFVQSCDTLSEFHCCSGSLCRSPLVRACSQGCIDGDEVAYCAEDSAECAARPTARLSFSVTDHVGVVATCPETPTQFADDPIEIAGTVQSWSETELVLENADGTTRTNFEGFELDSSLTSSLIGDSLRLRARWHRVRRSYQTEHPCAREIAIERETGELILWAMDGYEIDGTSSDPLHQIRGFLESGVTMSIAELDCPTFEKVCEGMRAGGTIPVATWSIRAGSSESPIVLPQGENGFLVHEGFPYSVRNVRSFSNGTCVDSLYPDIAFWVVLVNESEE